MALNLVFKMTFYINGIKEAKNKNKDQTNLEFLISTRNEEETREFTSKYWIIVLSLKEILWDIKWFGNFYFIINHWLSTISITPKKENRALQEICKDYIWVWFDITTIKDYLNQLTEINIKEIIYEARKDLEEQQSIQKTYIDKQQEKEKQFFEDKALDKLKEVIKRVLPRCDEILWVLSKEGSLNPKTIREIKDSQENIKKLSMWTNSEKIKDSLQKLFYTIEQLETDYYKTFKKDWNNILADSIVTHSDILKEDYKLQYARNKNKAWLAINANNQYYLIFWKIWIFLNFLKADLLNKVIETNGVIKKAYDLIELSILFIVCEITFYIVLLYFIDDSKIPSLLIWLINIGIMWLSFSLLKILSKNSKYLFYSVIPLCILLFFIIKIFITSNFAL